MKLLICSIFLVSLTACSSNMRRGSGKIVKQTRSVVGFKGVETSASIKVEVTQGNEYKVEVSADDNLIELVETKLDGDLLKVGYKPNTSINNPHITVYVTAPKFSKLISESSSSITATNTIVNSDELYLKTSSSGYIKTNVDCYKLEAEASSSGNIDVSGKCDNMTAKATSSGSINGQNLATSISKATANSSGNVKLNASNTLNAAAHSSGRVQ